MKNRFIYINLDGFGQYYYRLLSDEPEKIPNLMSLIGQGTLFENVHTGIPSITFPMQCAIVSGAYSDKTGNCYQYLDREKSEIVLCGRQNQAQTVGEVLKNQQIPFVSIQQFALQDKGCSGNDPDYLYVQPGGDYQVRFDVLLELLNNNRVKSDGKEFYFQQLPRAIFLYVDDLDTIGHNHPRSFSFTEEGRVQNVLNRLQDIDKCLGEMLAVLREKGLYEETNILLTTDHGMVPFQGKSMITPLIQKLHQLGFSKVYTQGPGKVTEKDWDVLLTSHDIQCQLYLEEEGIRLSELKQELMQLDFVEQVLTKQELINRGVSPKFADILISPREGMHFNINHSFLPVLCAAHDSLNQKCQNVFAVMKGEKIKSGYIETRTVRTIDFMPTLCKLCELPMMENATGEVLTSIIQ